MNSDLIINALSQYGEKETTGSKHNPDIVAYFKEAGHSGIKDDETAWCSAFVNAIAKRAGYVTSGALNARSWMAVGQETKEPQPGDVAVLWRESKTSFKGHVAFFVREDEQYVYLLGGNQNNQVCIAPFTKDRVLGYRRLIKRA